MIAFQVSKKAIKGLVHPKMKSSPCFTHPQGILGVCDFLLSDESYRSCINYYPCSSKHYNGIHIKMCLTRFWVVNKGKRSDSLK